MRVRRMRSRLDAVLAYEQMRRFEWSNVAPLRVKIGHDPEWGHAEGALPLYAEFHNRARFGVSHGIDESVYVSV